MKLASEERVVPAEKQLVRGQELGRREGRYGCSRVRERKW